MYDAEHRLVCVEQTRSGDVERIVFGYDPLGRRISKAVYKPHVVPQDGVTARYHSPAPEQASTYKHRTNPTARDPNTKFQAQKKRP